MDACEVAIVGGGPGGSACAWSLRRAGVDVLVIDGAVFPRDKVCAGWITPQVLEALHIDPGRYRANRTLEPISRFRVGVIGDDKTIEASYDHPVSFAIRRCEFDEYLLRRSRARILCGTSVSRIRREGARWILNETTSAGLLVGAGGHFCPVARMITGASERAPLIAAQEVELPLDARACTVAAGTPEIYFCSDLAGYGWCVRKGPYVNIGLGRLDPHGLPAATAAFVDFLRARGRLAVDPLTWRWHGHAYLTAGSPRARRAVGEAVMLVGDAAGLASPHSGEGIRPAIESGLMAASTIIAANGRYARHRLEPYATDLQQRFGVTPGAHLLSAVVPARLLVPLGLRLLEMPWFVRHIVLDRWFLHGKARALAPATASIA